MMLKGGGGQNALFKIAAKQYLGQMMMLRGGVGGLNTLLKVATKQFLEHLVRLDYALFLMLYSNSLF